MKTAAVLLVALLAVASDATAHRLDDYLQASRLAVTRDRITIELDLTPGALIADQIFPLIDRDADGSVSASEIERYARLVMNDLALEVDGVAYELTLMRAESPTWSDIREGMGVIRIEAGAAVPFADGTHRIRFANRHRPDIGVYLANVLAPSSGDLAVLRQQRDPQQREFTVEISITAPTTSTAWAFGQAILAATLLICRGRGRGLRR